MRCHRHLCLPALPGKPEDYQCTLSYKTIGQAIGARDKKRAATDTGNTATLFMVLSVVLTVVLFLSVNAIVSIMSTPEEALAGTAL
mgnify:CR=1 FL=1